MLAKTAIKLHAVGHVEVLQVDIVLGGSEGGACNGVLQDILLVELAENIAGLHAKGQVMEELIRISPVGFVYAAMPCIIGVGYDLVRTLDVVGNVELVILGAEGYEADAGAPV